MVACQTVACYPAAVVRLSTPCSLWFAERSDLCAHGCILCAVGLLPFHTQVVDGAAAQSCGYVSVSVRQPAHPLLLPGSQLQGLASCCCQVIEEQLVGGLSAAMAAASPAVSRLSTDGSSVQGKRRVFETGPGHQVMAVGAESRTLSYSYSCVPRGQPEAAAVLEGYTCGTVVGSCVHLHYGSCPEMVQHIAQRCLRVDVALATAAANAAASRATAQAGAAAADGT